MFDRAALDRAVENGLVTEESRERIIRYVARLERNRIPVLFNLRHVRKVFCINRKEQDLFFGEHRSELYREFEIPKKSGGMRKIQAPTEKLKAIQRWIKDQILDQFSLSQYATGFKKGCSIVDNARKHVGKELVINLDLKNFFPSIHYAEVVKVFSYMGYRRDVAHLLTRLCTNGNNVLPQGSPASPALSNLVSLRLDERLGRLAESLDASYTRYADDITFSGSKSLRTVVPLIREIIQEEGFIINEDKVRLRYAHQRQEVTGLIVNERISVAPRVRKELDTAIYYCNKYGVSDHMAHIGCDKCFYKEHLYGIAYFIKMVDLEKGTIYLDKLDRIEW